jgi:type IV pilus assembly protein PilA
LVELMIVVALVGVLASLAMPLYQRMTVRAKCTRFHSDLRIASQAMETYAMERGEWPPDGAGGWPALVYDYLPPPTRWNLPTPVGGRWGWARDIDGVDAALQITGYEGGAERGVELDRLIDDGDLTAGLLRGTDNRLLYVMQP